MQLFSMDPAINMHRKSLSVNEPEALEKHRRLTAASGMLLYTTEYAYL